MHMLITIFGSGAPEVGSPDTALLPFNNLYPITRKNRTLIIIIIYNTRINLFKDHGALFYYLRFSNDTTESLNRINYFIRKKEG